MCLRRAASEQGLRPSRSPGASGTGRRQDQARADAARGQGMNAKAGYVDTHCHLDAAEFDADRQAVLTAARAGGVLAVVVPAVDRGSMAAVAALRAREAGVVAAFGIHPLYAGSATDDDLRHLAERLENDAPAAVGEIGLDHFVADVDHDRQASLFEAQLGLARKFELPVLLHLRRAQDQVLKRLRAIRVRGGIAHAFNGSWQQAEAFMALGFKLGFGGALTYPRALRLRELAARLPLSAIVLETDAPDIPPVWRANRRSEPVDVLRVAQTVAALRGIDVDEVAAETTANACAIIPRLAEQLAVVASG